MFVFPGDTTKFAKDGVFVGRVPNRMIMGLLDSQAFNGDMAPARSEYVETRRLGPSKNCTSYMWNNVPSGNADSPGHRNPKKSGSIKIGMTFRAVRITELIWGDFEGSFDIASNSSVLYKNT